MDMIKIRLIGIIAFVFLGLGDSFAANSAVFGLYGKVGGGGLADSVGVDLRVSDRLDFMFGFSYSATEIDDTDEESTTAFALGVSFDVVKKDKGSLFVELAAKYGTQSMGNQSDPIGTYSVGLGLCYWVTEEIRLSASSNIQYDIVEAAGDKSLRVWDSFGAGASYFF